MDHPGRDAAPLRELDRTDRAQDEWSGEWPHNPRASTVKNSRDHACCMPTAPLPATIWVAFTRAKPSQSRAIQRQSTMAGLVAERPS